MLRKANLLCSAVATAALSVITGLAASPAARGEDIDIYAGAPGALDLATVLILLDNSANWGSAVTTPRCYYRNNGVATSEEPIPGDWKGSKASKLYVEKCALHNLIDAVPTGPAGEARINVGLMLATKTGTSGGYPRRAILRMDAAGKTALKNAVKAIQDSDKNSAASPFSLVMHEAFLYLSSRAPRAGYQVGVPYDASAFAAGGTTYTSPGTAGCGLQHVIVLANGSPNQDSAGQTVLASVGGSTAHINLPGVTGNQENQSWGEEYARFLRTTDVGTSSGRQPVTTHAVAVTDGSTSNPELSYIANISAFAQYGGGKFAEARNADDIVNALTEIFIQILAVNSNFASASLPISVNARGTYLNQIFMGMFRPDAEGLPRWNGNVKQYRFAYDRATDSLQLVDALGRSAISGSSGFIDPAAVSYWTSSSNFFVNEPKGSPESTSDSPDGAVVEKGGAAQRLRTTFATSQAARKVLTCVGCAAGTTLGSSAATLFVDTNAAITGSALGVGTDTTARANLINWIRGTDNFALDELGPGGTTTIRPSVHGDVLHSRPAAVNYGSRVVVFYGANDGMLHAIDGQQTTASGGGAPLWSFVPQEVFGRLNRLRSNDPIVKYEAVPDNVDAAPRDYFVDGPIGLLQRFTSTGATSQAIIYVAMRRGGRVLYALDVTDPDAPRFLWKVTNANIPVLGQTWSEPKVARVRGHANPVIIMGAGYDPAEDSRPAGATTMGNSVLVLDAITGALLRSFSGITRPVPADVTLVDTDADGFIDVAYAVDLGGNIHRIDMEVGGGSPPSDWRRTTLASLGDTDGNKMFYGPDVVRSKRYSVVMVGTGDREKPLESTTQDYFFAVIDANMGKVTPLDYQTVVFNQLVDRTNFQSALTQKGCFYQLPAGEKVVNAPLTTAGSTYFGTNRPTPAAAGSCSINLGLARNYAIPLLCRAPEITDYIGGGLPPSPVSGVVEVETVNPTTGQLVTRPMPFIIGGKNSKGSPIEGSRVNLPVSPRRSKLYWYPDTER